MNAPSDALRALHVLIVDDDADIAESLAEVLALQGFRTRAVTSGEDAVRSAEVDPPDVILTDLRMPRVDGFEVARRIRALNRVPAPLVVAITAYATALSRGTEPHEFDLVFLKPFDPAALIDALNQFAADRG